MNIKQSIRIIFRNKTYSLLNIAGLTIGITASALLLLWVEYHANNNRDVPKRRNIYEVGQNQPGSNEIVTNWTVSDALFQNLQNNIPGVIRCSRFQNATFNFEDENKSISQQGAYVDSTLFSMIDLMFIAGSRQTAFASYRPIVVSQSMAKRFFEDDNPVGKTLTMDNISYQVTGVFKDRDANGLFFYDCFIPFQILADRREYGGGNTQWSNWFMCYVETEPNTNIAVINERLSRFGADNSTMNWGNEIFLFSVKDRWLYGEFKDGKPVGTLVNTMRMLFGLSMAILLFACINFMNLSIARNQRRSLEVGLRKTFGANRFGLIRQFTGESAIIVSISIVLAIMLILVTLPAFNAFVSLNIKVDFFNTWQTGGLLAIGLMCVLLSSAYPSLYLSAFSPLNSLKKMKTILPNGVIWAQKSLLVFQFAITFIMVSVVLIIYLQIRHLNHRPLGMDINHLVFFQTTTNEISRNFAAVQEQLNNSGYATHSGLSNQQIIRLGMKDAGFNWQGKDLYFDPVVRRAFVSWGLFETFGLHFIEGSDFSYHYFSQNAAKGVIINRSFADIMGDEGHAGRFVEKNNESFSIVGIVEDFVSNDVRQAKVDPAIFFPNHLNSSNLFVRLNKNFPEKEAVAGIQKVLQSFSPEATFEPTYANDYFNFKMSLNIERFIGRVAGLFAILAIVISSIGLYGLSAFEVERRTKEIGIRRVLGASIWNILRLLGSAYLQLLIVSFVVAAPVAWYFGQRWLENFGYRISLELYIFVAAGLLVALISMLAASLHAWKAATANPVEAIKK